MTDARCRVFFSEPNLPKPPQRRDDVQREPREHGVRRFLAHADPLPELYEGLALQIVVPPFDEEGHVTISIRHRTEQIIGGRELDPRG